VDILFFQTPIPKGQKDQIILVFYILKIL